MPPLQHASRLIVGHERADWLVIVLLYLFVQRFESSLVLLLERGFLDVFALGRAVKTQPSFIGKFKFVGQTKASGARWRFAR